MMVLGAYWQHMWWSRSRQINCDENERISGATYFAGPTNRQRFVGEAIPAAGPDFLEVGLGMPSENSNRRL